MKLGFAFVSVVVLVLLTCAMFLTAGWRHPPVVATQTGYRGTGMDQIVNPVDQAVLKYANSLPDKIDPASAEGDKATTTYKNVKVLTDLSTDQFNRVMLSITEWVAPVQGCGYCHNVENLADDGLYTKVVARKMLEMTRHINTDWKQHVAATGVTCYTCHRGMPVPSNIWFSDPAGAHAGGFAASNNGMGHPVAANGTTTMPFDPFSAHLEGEKGKDSIRVQPTRALAVADTGSSIQTVESTYALMIHMSESLGVNCTFCHNSRAFEDWAQSTPQRVTAWYGIQMVRDLNENFLDSLKSVFPAARLGPHGDNPKLDCATCHQGVNKPMYGLSLAKDYPELGGVSSR
jgi:photosynthetic reaction center cytochrome c subunit